MNVFQAGLFEGKVVLITGGGTGIGRALALAFGELGAMVVIAARREGPLSEVVKTIEDRGGRACMYTLDVRDEARVEEVVRGIWQDVGGVDVLVNNAGGNFTSPAVAMSAHGFRTVLDINLVGTFLMSQAVGRRWPWSGVGRVFVSTRCCPVLCVRKEVTSVCGRMRRWWSGWKRGFRWGVSRRPATWWAWWCFWPRKPGLF
ncbi:SDR family NAD(P)-dependent oxidoreductase [Bradymonadaceae bacterium TMQ3]|nr:SDR family NAD(P)-dependent oxidoreductase [Bradymonadaceae bacterium TMQ3]TXC76863.1 SDR family NAD(P)-dependent oxidoreductase [Bradymonadales bacterium TMQ1]